MKHVQKFVLVPIEKWEKVKEKDMNLKEVTVQVPTQKVMNQEIQKKEDFTVESPVDSPSNIEENSRQSEQEETNRYGEKEISDISLSSCEEEK